MSGSFWRASGLAVLGLALSGCAATRSTQKVAVDYNRAFADSRDEVLLLNILRASARESLQFSTMGTVTGTVGNSGSLTLPFANIIGGGKDDVFALSPSLTLNDGINPSVTIIPLSSKEFTQGLLKPISVETINYFLHQGWNADFVLPLVVGGIVCPDGKIVLNRGDRPDYDWFATMFADAPLYPLSQSPEGEPVAVLRMAGKDAAGFVKDGVGKGRKIKSVVPVEDEDGPTGEVKVTIVETGGLVFAALPTGALCASADTRKVDANVLSNLRSSDFFVPLSAPAGTAPPDGAGSDSTGVLLRSVEAILYFLGETHRARLAVAGTREEYCRGQGPETDWPHHGAEDDRKILFQVHRACDTDALPLHTAVSTKFHGRTYYIQRAEDSAVADRTLKTMSFLNALIALQTSESTIEASTPLVVVGD